MKKFYEAPEMMIEVVDCSDVITSSEVAPACVNGDNACAGKASKDNEIDIEDFTA